MAKTAWIFSYKLKKSVTPEEFMERTQALHDAVISKAKGFLSWEHYLPDSAQDGTWTAFVLWESEVDARHKFELGVIAPKLAPLWMSRHGYSTKTEAVQDTVREDDPITRSLKEAEDVLRKTAAGAPLAVPGAGEKSAHL